MKTKKQSHTPGPWRIHEERIISDIGPVAGIFGRVEWMENARLIAAAPELLRFAEAIKESVNDALKPGSPDTFMSLVKRLSDYRRWAEAAIAKAEGK